MVTASRAVSGLSPEGPVTSAALLLVRAHIAMRLSCPLLRWRICDGCNAAFEPVLRQSFLGCHAQRLRRLNR